VSIFGVSVRSRQGVDTPDRRLHRSWSGPPPVFPHPFAVLPAATVRPPRAAIVLGLALVVGAGCGGSAAARPDPARDAALRDTLTAIIADAYDFSRPDVVSRLMALYPTSGPVVSAAAGRVSTTRAALQQSIGSFWQRIGQNMVGPKFVIGQRYATALGPDAAVLTITYTIPHHTPEGRPHTLGGAWTAVFVRRDGRWRIVQEHLSDLPAQPTPATTMPDSMHMP
jgi:ketosteroid isomerase-like protein